MSESTQTTSGGIGVLGLLGVAFVVLKLTGYITWSWWWVTAPFWGGFVLLAIFLLVFVGVSLLRDWHYSRVRARRERARRAAR